MHYKMGHLLAVLMHTNIKAFIQLSPCTLLQITSALGMI